MGRKPDSSAGQLDTRPRREAHHLPGRQPPIGTLEVARPAAAMPLRKPLTGNPGSSAGCGHRGWCARGRPDRRGRPCVPLPFRPTGRSPPAPSDAPRPLAALPCLEFSIRRAAIAGAASPRTAAQSTTLVMPVSSSSVMKIACPRRALHRGPARRPRQLPLGPERGLGTGRDCSAAKTGAEAPSDAPSATGAASDNRSPPARPAPSPAGRPQLGPRLGPRARPRARARLGRGEERQRRADRLAPRLQSAARRSSPIEPKASASASAQAPRRQPRLARQRLDRVVAAAPRRDEPPASSLRTPSAWRKPSRSRSPRLPGSDCCPRGCGWTSTGRSSTMPRASARSAPAHKSHRQGAFSSAGEDRRMMAFELGRDIDQRRERGGVALGKAIAAEPLDLLEQSCAKPRS